MLRKSSAPENTHYFFHLVISPHDSNKYCAVCYTMRNSWCACYDKIIFRSTQISCPFLYVIDRFNFFPLLRIAIINEMIKWLLVKKNNERTNHIIFHIKFRQSCRRQYSCVCASWLRVLHSKKWNRNIFIGCSMARCEVGHLVIFFDFFLWNCELIHIIDAGSYYLIPFHILRSNQMYGKVGKINERQAIRLLDTHEI